MELVAKVLKGLEKPKDDLLSVYADKNAGPNIAAAEPEAGARGPLDTAGYPSYLHSPAVAGIGDNSCQQSLTALNATARNVKNDFCLPSFLQPILCKRLATDRRYQLARESGKCCFQGPHAPATERSTGRLEWG